MAKNYAIKLKPSGRTTYGVGTLADTGSAYGNKTQADYYRGKAKKANLKEAKKETVKKLSSFNNESSTREALENAIKRKHKRFQ